MTHQLDDPRRIDQLRSTIRNKPALFSLYHETYQAYRTCAEKCPLEGMMLELGSGGGFVKEILPEVITSDVLPYPGVDQVVDAAKLPFADGSLRAIFMLNVFHHLPDAAAFLGEAERCLVPGGRVLIVDQHRGPLSRPIYRHLHHEPWREDVNEWHFDSSGPLSDGNGALAWIVFVRDRALFERRFPKLFISGFRPHTPLRYWLAGGLRPWSLLPSRAFGIATALDRALISASSRLGSFVDIELLKLD